MTDRTEQLIRDAFAEEARHAPDPRDVLAGLQRRRAPRRVGLVLATAAVVVVVAAVAAFVVPAVFRQSAPPAADKQQGQPAAVEPTSVLVVGADGNGNADTMGLLQLGADGALSLVSLPRDTWAAVPGAGMMRLNQVLKTSGIDTLVATVRDLTGVTVEHYVVMDMTAVGDLATAVGGVPVCLLAATEDRFAGASFPAGAQTISGATALAFVRQRHGLPNGDLDRIARQQAFMKSLAIRLHDADVSKVLPAIQGHLQTDQGLDVLGLAQSLVAATSYHLGVIPIDEVDHQTQEGGSVIAVDPATVKEFVAKLPETPAGDNGVPCVN